MRKENQRIMMTRRLFRENLIEILREKPIDKISVTELCKRAEINRSTFYAHYGVPNDVLLEIKRDLAARIVESLRSLDEKATLKEQFLRICEFIYANADLEKIIFANSADDEVMEAAMRYIFDTRNLSSFTRGGSMDADAQRLVGVFFRQGVFRMIREWITRDIPKTPSEIADIFGDILFSQVDAPESI